MLLILAILPATAVLMVSLSRRLGFGSVLGYLLAGVADRPLRPAARHRRGAIAGISELGIVMLLFLIGLELRPQRLWVMRRAVFGLGTAQVALTRGGAGAARARGRRRLGRRHVLGAGLAMSSTAIVLPMLASGNLLAQRPDGTLLRAAVPGPRLHPAGRPGAAARRREPSRPACPGLRCVRGRARDRRHPGRRPVPDRAAPSAPSAAPARRRCSPPWLC